MKRLIIALVLAALAVTPAPHTARADKPKARSWAVTVPFELLESGHMTIQVKINGKGPYRVIFDTGAPSILFSGKAAKESGAIDKNKGAFLLGSYGDATLDRVQVGDFAIENVRAQVQDHPTVEAIAAKLGRIDGLVGFPLFAPAKLTIDYQAKTITFIPRDASTVSEEDPNRMAMDLLMGKSKPVVVAPAAQWGLVVGKKKGDDAVGVDVETVRAGSAASAAGFKSGDRLLTLAGRWTESVEDVYRAAGHTPPDKPTKVTVRRDGKEFELTVTPRSGL